MTERILEETREDRRRLDSAVLALRGGQFVILTDRARPERGGVVMALAAHAGASAVNFMASEARGLVAVAIEAARAEALGLPLQAAASLALGRENYTVSVEAREGVSTGISAADRAATLGAMADPKTTAAMLVTPGHIFPAIALEGGVLERAGWAEAAVDLAKAAKATPAVAFCEVLDAAGELAVGGLLSEFGTAHGIAQVDMAALVAHRMNTETFVEALSTTPLRTRWGVFDCHVFIDRLGHKQHLAFSLGDVRGEVPVLVRVHSECLTGDVLGSMRCDCGHQLSAAMQRIVEEGRGVALYLRQEGRGIGLVNKVNAYALQDAGRDTVEANLDLGFDADARDFRVGAQMLLALGARKIRLMTNNPRKVADLTRFGLEVTSREPIELEPGAHNTGYLRAKKEKLGHLLTKV
jgi:3,4-dihydroxy 2-butanone 4-phosphate synthase/GTP cyclohydrolase II